MRRGMLARAGLWIAGLGFGAMFAAGPFNAVALMPNWARDPSQGVPLMRELLSLGPTAMRTFFVPIAAVTLLGTGLAIAAGWSVPRLRAVCLVVGSLFVALMVVNVAVVLPLDLRLFGEGLLLEGEALSRASAQYVRVHVVRLVLMVLGAAVSLSAAAN